MTFASPEQTDLPDRFSSDPFEVVLFHLIAIESAAAARRQKAREAANRKDAQLPLFDPQLPLF